MSIQMPEIIRIRQDPRAREREKVSVEEKEETELKRHQLLSFVSAPSVSSRLFSRLFCGGASSGSLRSFPSMFSAKVLRPQPGEVEARQSSSRVLSRVVRDRGGERASRA